MKKGFITLLSILLLVNYCYSRKDHIIELFADSTVFNDLDFYIAEVEDDRIDSTDFGFIIIGAMELKRNVSFKGSMTEQIKNYTSKAIRKNESSFPVKLKIKKLKVSEKEYTEENGTCELTIEYYDMDDNLLYMTDDKASLVAPQLSKHINILIGDLINRSLFLFSLYDLRSEIYYDLLGLNDPFDSMLLNTKIKKGFYANFYEFQANNPSIKIDFDSIQTQKAGKENALKNTQFDYQTLLDIVYGFSDGENIYFKRQTTDNRYSFVQVKELGRYCYVGQKTDQQLIPTPFFFVWFPVKQDYILNIRSGNEYPLNDDNLKIILGSDQPLLEKYKSQPFDTRTNMLVFWIKEFNRRYIERNYKN